VISFFFDGCGSPSRKKTSFSLAENVPPPLCTRARRYVFYWELCHEAFFLFSVSFPRDLSTLPTRSFFLSSQKTLCSSRRYPNNMRMRSLTVRHPFSPIAEGAPGYRQGLKSLLRAAVFSDERSRKSARNPPPPGHSPFPCLYGERHCRTTPIETFFGVNDSTLFPLR